MVQGLGIKKEETAKKLALIKKKKGKKNALVGRPASKLNHEDSVENEKEYQNVLQQINDISLVENQIHTAADGSESGGLHSHTESYSDMYNSLDQYGAAPKLLETKLSIVAQRKD